jgi:hypothetical protein
MRTWIEPVSPSPCAKDCAPSVSAAPTGTTSGPSCSRFVAPATCGAPRGLDSPLFVIGHPF